MHAHRGYTPPSDEGDGRWGHVDSREAASHLNRWRNTQITLCTCTGDLTSEAERIDRAGSLPGTGGGEARTSPGIIVSRLTFRAKRQRRSMNTDMIDISINIKYEAAANVEMSNGEWRMCPCQSSKKDQRLLNCAWMRQQRRAWSDTPWRPL